MQDLIPSLTPICGGLDPYSSFSRVSVLAAAATTTPIDVARLDLPADPSLRRRVSWTLSSLGHYEAACSCHPRC